MGLIIGFLFWLFIAFCIAFGDFFRFLALAERLFKPAFSRAAEITTIVLCPVLYLLSDFEEANCCEGGVAFARAHQTIIYILILACIAAYVYSTYRNKTSPLAAVLTNVLLLIGIILNPFVAYQVAFSEAFLELPVWVLINVPIELFFIIRLCENHLQFVDQIDKQQFQLDRWYNRLSWQVINAAIYVKYPVLLILITPFLVILTSILMLFGQRPDAIILAFTQTYKHGFSQLDHLCDNVHCGGHYLCSVAANGHKNIVQPVRYGQRHGRLIICNRQLLVSNAFEELVAEKMPYLHRIIRRYYDKVGDIVHRYYYLFQIKAVSDIVYFLMKPLEWCFLLVLYLLDTQPENRIAMQYLSVQDRQVLQKLQQD